MKKIMFSDKFLFTKAVLEGRKTQTMQLIKCRKTFKGEWVAGFNVHIRPSDKKVVGLPCMYDVDEREFDGGEILPKYNVGEIVAVAQSYRDCGGFSESGKSRWEIIAASVGATNGGWNDKRFVRASFMPHQILITNMRIERLQDISENDAIAEGITYAGLTHEDYGEPMFIIEGCKRTFGSARDAYTWFIDKISGKGTWQSNPYVFVYDFELVK